MPTENGQQVFSVQPPSQSFPSAHTAGAKFLGGVDEAVDDGVCRKFQPPA